MLWKELNRNKPSLLHILLIVLTYLLYIIENVCMYVITFEYVQSLNMINYYYKLYYTLYIVI